jgi:hypothetical protein
MGENDPQWRKHTEWKEKMVPNHRNPNLAVVRKKIS